MLRDVSELLEEASADESHPCGRKEEGQQEEAGEEEDRSRNNSSKPSIDAEEERRWAFISSAVLGRVLH